MQVKILRGFLWFAFVYSSVLSLSWWAIRDSGRGPSRQSESAETKLVRDLGEELNWFGGFPTAAILSAGFLLASYSIDSVRAAVEAGRSTPDERRAEIREALVSAAERRAEPATAPQTERKTGQPAPRRPAGEGRE